MCEVRIQYARQYFDCRHYGGAAKYRIAARCFKPTRRCSVNGGSGGDGGGYGGYNKPGTGGGAGGAVSCYSHEKVEGARSLLPGLCPECKAAASVKILRGRGMDEQKLVVVEREAERWHGEIHHRRSQSEVQSGFLDRFWNLVGSTTKAGSRTSVTTADSDNSYEDQDEDEDESSRLLVGLGEEEEEAGFV